MTMQTVKSTLIQAIGYNPLTEQLSVTMQKKMLERLTFFVESVERLLMILLKQNSKGQYFNRNIRGRFPTTKVC